MQDATPENKLRLMMIFATVYPERFEGDKASKLMQVIGTHSSINLLLAQPLQEIQRRETFYLIPCSTTAFLKCLSYQETRYEDK